MNWIYGLGLICILLSSSVEGQIANQADFNEALKRHSPRMSVRDMEFPESMVMRSELLWVEADLLRVLTEQDIQILNNLEQERVGREALQPYLENMEQLLESGAPAAEIASVWMEAIRAESQALANYYTEVIESLSPDAKRLMMKKVANSETWDTHVSATDWVALAREYPDLMRSRYTLSIRQWRSTSKP